MREAPDIVGTGRALCDSKGRFMLAGIPHSQLVGHTFAQYALRVGGPDDGVGVLIHREALAETDRPHFPPPGAFRFSDVTIEDQARLLPPQEMRRMIGIGPGSEVLLTGVGPAIVIVDAEVADIASAHRQQIEELIHHVTLQPEAAARNERHVHIELPALPREERGSAMCNAILSVIDAMRADERITDIRFTISTAVAAQQKKVGAA